MTISEVILTTTVTVMVLKIPDYFIQRYFFKGILDKHLDKIENGVISLLRRK